ncbi:MAG: alpha/beta hydrolase [Acidobacteriota bacterium]|nr:alpha/beta hydrolase [Acidobacteriota bacterium]
MRLTAIWVGLRALLVGGTMLCLAVFFFQRRLIYFPEREDEARALAFAKVHGLEPWRDGRGSIMGWIARSIGGAAEGRLLICHGNAGTALGRLYYAQGLQSTVVPRRWEIRILEYPGYGSRPGAPSEPVLVKAAVAAIDALDKETPLPLILVGESIGSGVAALAAAQRPASVKGLFLVTPLNRMRDLARIHYPYLPTFLVRDRFEAATALRDFHGPLAVLLAERDEIIPPRLGQAVFDGHSGPKRLWIAKGSGHNDWDVTPSNPMWAEASEFLLPR